MRNIEIRFGVFALLISMALWVSCGGQSGTAPSLSESVATARAEQKAAAQQFLYIVRGAAIETFAIQSDGTPLATGDTIPVPSQGSVHLGAPTPDGRFVFATMDQSLVTYRVHHDGRLQQAASTALVTGGQVSLAMHPSGAFLFASVAEAVYDPNGPLTYTGRIMTYAVSPSGKLDLLNTASGTEAVWALKVSSDGRDLYATVAGAIAQYRIGARGELTSAGAVTIGDNDFLNRTLSLEIHRNGLSAYASTDAGIVTLSRDTATGNLAVVSTTAVSAQLGLLINATGTVLFASRPRYSIVALAIDPTSRVPAPVPTSVVTNPYPETIAVDGTGSYLFVMAEQSIQGLPPISLVTYRVSPNGVLSAVSGIGLSGYLGEMTVVSIPPNGPQL